jgi:hypothetical protein
LGDILASTLSTGKVMAVPSGTVVLDACAEPAGRGTYFFVIDNFVKHANAKGYNRHVATGAMQLSELLSVRQEALGLLLLENYREPWKQLVEYMKQGESAVPSNIEPAKAKYTNPGQKKMPWKSEGMEQYNQLHEEVRQDQLLSEGQRFEIRFKNKMKQEAGMAQSRKRKTIQLVNVAAVHELDDVSSNDDSSHGANKLDQRMEVVLAAEPAIQLVCSTNVMDYIGIALEYTA